jgi:hypothetical protein
MALAEGMAAGHQGNGLLVVHAHAAKGHADIAAGGEHIRHTVRAFRVDVNQAHLHGGQRVFQIAIAGVAAVRLAAGGQPFLFGTPVHIFFRLIDVIPATAEAKGLEAHRLHGTVAGQDDQVGPGDLVAVLFS